MTVDQYLALPWTYTVETFTKDNETVFMVQVNELPGLRVGKPSVGEAMEIMKEIMADAIQSMLDRGQAVPEPVDPHKYKGNIAYRTSNVRHCAVAKEAKKRGMSLSRLIDECIDSSLNERSR